MQTFTANKLNKFRKESLNGIEYLVSPVRMIREGVLNGSRGALYYPMEEISESTDAWNHMPIVVNHPKKGSRFVSARDPQVLNQYGVGFVFNAKESGDALDAEAWIDINKLRTVHSSLAEAVERGESIEVSTGLQTDNFNDKGVFNGKDYDYTARNYKPDHLALLPGEEGACSINDGCGLNVNQNFKVDFVANCGGKSSCSCGCSKKGSTTMIDFQTTKTNNIDFVTNEDGVWRTTDEGAKVFIQGGKVHAGGPNGKVVAGGDSKGKSKGKKSDPKTKSPADQPKPPNLDKANKKYRNVLDSLPLEKYGGLTDKGLKELARQDPEGAKKLSQAARDFGAAKTAKDSMYLGTHTDMANKLDKYLSSSSKQASPVFTEKKLSAALKGTKFTSLSTRESMVLSKLISENKNSGIEVLDYLGLHIGGYSEKQWDSFMDGRHKDVVTKRDPASKMKLVKAVTKLPQAKSK